MNDRNDLYKAIVAYEDAANAVGTQSMNTQSAYVSLAKAIGGWGDLGEARARFRLESAAFVNASNALTAAAGAMELALTEQPETVWPRVTRVGPDGKPIPREADGGWFHMGKGVTVEFLPPERYRTLAEREPSLADLAKGCSGNGGEE